MPHFAACSSCGKAIIWTMSPNGARLPLSAKAVTVYTLDEGQDPPNAVKVESEEKVYISHFVDCPNANQHSKK